MAAQSVDGKEQVALFQEARLSKTGLDTRAQASIRGQWQFPFIPEQRRLAWKPLRFAPLLFPRANE